nr:autotransporter outer membrane beta-barrel domain-containing protein [uncultured Enterobacter sp.]
MNFIGFEDESYADAGLYLSNPQGMGTELINSGSIIGSVRMDGWMNRLSLMDDWSISGFVTAPYSFENRSNILNLTGDQDSALDLSRVQRVFDTAMAMLPQGSTAIDGFDTLIKDGNSRWNLTGEQLSGGFNSAEIQQGGLLLNNATLRMALVDGTTRDDFVYPESGESLGEEGIRRSVAIAPTGSLLVAGAAKVVGGLSNAGQLYINDGTSSSATFNTLNITGDYAGLPGSTVIFNTALGDDSSSTDRLIIAGSTSGESAVVVNNLGGSGAQTVEGIGLISVGGSSDATFNKQSRIVAGSFDYDLVKKGSDWVLTSQFVPEDSTDDSENSTGGNEENSGGSEGSTGGSEGNTGGNEDNTGGNESSTGNGSSAGVPAAGVRTWRPEAGSYSANLLAANTLFGTSLQDRTGEGYYTDALTGERKATSMWLRNAGGYQRSRMNDGQNTTRANQYVLQLGGDVAQWSTNGQDGIHAGVMAGYANQKSRTTSGLTGYRSRGTTNGYSTGLYATWYENEAAREGLYVDGWLQYSWFDHSVKGDEIAAEYYRSRGFTGSLESGYAFRAGGTGSADKRGTGFWLEPQVQATWMGVKASDVIEHNGTRVQARGQDNLRSRLGIKAYARSEGPATGANDAEFRPYIQTSWIHDSNNFGVRMDGTDSIVAGTRNVAEVKVGLESRLNSDVNLWGDISHQAGDHGFSDSQAALGIRYAF